MENNHWMFILLIRKLHYIVEEGLISANKNSLISQNIPSFQAHI